MGQVLCIDHADGGEWHGHEGYTHVHPIDNETMLCASISDGLGVAKLTRLPGAPKAKDLNVFLTDAEGRLPLAVPLTAFTSMFTNTTSPSSTSVLFEAADETERPEAEAHTGCCSHFVARMPAGLDLRSAYNVDVHLYTIQGDKIQVHWSGFRPTKHSHQHLSSLSNPKLFHVV